MGTQVVVLMDDGKVVSLLSVYQIRKGRGKIIIWTNHLNPFTIQPRYRLLIVTLVFLSHLSQILTAQSTLPNLLTNQFFNFSIFPARILVTRISSRSIPSLLQSWDTIKMMSLLLIQFAFWL